MLCIVLFSVLPKKKKRRSPQKYFTCDRVTIFSLVMPHGDLFAVSDSVSDISGTFFALPLSSAFLASPATAA